MTNIAERIQGRRGILALLILLPLIVWEAYAIWLGRLVQFAKSSPSALLYFALIGALGAAWGVVDLEYFPKLSGLSRKTRVWFIVGVNLWCAGLVLVWLEPRLALPIVIFNFIIVDVMGFQAARDLLRRAPRRAER